MALQALDSLMLFLVPWDGYEGDEYDFAMKKGAADAALRDTHLSNPIVAKALQDLCVLFWVLGC